MVVLLEMGHFGGGKRRPFFSCYSVELVLFWAVTEGCITP